ncbi:MAG: GNAT family N-acetyltransferase [Candidatus Aenigmatarchaeota archaeon]
MKRVSRKINFKTDYIKFSRVQFKQNQKFLKFIYDILKDKEYIGSIVEIGIGSGHLAERLNRMFSPQRLYLIDINKYFLEHASKLIPNARCVNKDILNVTIEDLDGRFVDVVVASNFLHWLSLRNGSWLNCVKLVYSFLNQGGYFFVHQGLKWTYFPLYDLGAELFERMFGKKIDISEVLYYPYCHEILTNFKEAGFTVVAYKDFYELENSAPYKQDDLYVSFSVAGINAFLSQIEDEKMKKMFEKEFLELCRIYNPPIFSHRGFFALRKPYTDLDFRLIPPQTANDKEKQKLTDFIKEVSSDFVPPLETRTPDSEFREANLNYAEYLLRYYYNLVCFLRENSDEWVGLLSFRIRESFSRPGVSCFYVSTLAVRRPFRNAKVASKLYQYFLDTVIGKYFGERKIYLVETRTWADNVAVKKLLKNLGFSLTLVIPHDRGENIHTEYYVKEIR